MRRATRSPPLSATCRSPAGTYTWGFDGRGADGTHAADRPVHVARDRHRRRARPRHRRSPSRPTRSRSSRATRRRGAARRSRSTSTSAEPLEARPRCYVYQPGVKTLERADDEDRDLHLRGDDQAQDRRRRPGTVTFKVDGCRHGWANAGDHAGLPAPLTPDRGQPDDHPGPHPSAPYHPGPGPSSDGIGAGAAPALRGPWDSAMRIAVPMTASSSVRPTRRRARSRAAAIVAGVLVLAGTARLRRRQRRPRPGSDPPRPPASGRRSSTRRRSAHAGDRIAFAAGGRVSGPVHAARGRPLDGRWRARRGRSPPGALSGRALRDAPPVPRSGARLGGLDLPAVDPRRVPSDRPTPPTWTRTTVDPGRSRRRRRSRRPPSRGLRVPAVLGADRRLDPARLGEALDDRLLRGRRRRQRRPPADATPTARRPSAGAAGRARR